MEEIIQEQLVLRIANIWIVNDKNQVLLQKNNKPGHKSYSKWNASVTGKISAGDSLPGGAKRELEEELGLNVSKDSFTLLETQLYDERFPSPALVDIWLLKTFQSMISFYKILKLQRFNGMTLKKFVIGKIAE